MKKSRRNFVVGSVLAAGTLAAPGVRHVKWNRNSFEREDFSEEALPLKGYKNSWINWSRLHRATPRMIAEPEDEAALQNLLNETRGPIRPLGSGHSFSPLVPSEGTIINVNRLNGLRSHDLQNHLATFGAGTNLMQAARELNDIGSRIYKHRYRASLNHFYIVWNIIDANIYSWRPILVI